MRDSIVLSISFDKFLHVLLPYPTTNGIRKVILPRLSGVWSTSLDQVTLEGSVSRVHDIEIVPGKFEQKLSL